MRRIVNYIQKMWYLWIHQDKRCSGCGKIISLYQDGNTFYDSITGEKVDAAHYFPRWQKNIANHPNYIDCMLNISLQHNHCNVARLIPLDKKGKRQMRATYYKAGKAEAFLKRHPVLSAFVNGYFVQHY